MSGSDVNREKLINENELKEGTKWILIKHLKTFD